MFEAVAEEVSERTEFSRMRGSLLICWGGEEEMFECLRLLEVSEVEVAEYVRTGTREEEGVVFIEVAEREDAGDDGEEKAVSETLIWGSVVWGMKLRDAALSMLVGLC